MRFLFVLAALALPLSAMAQHDLDRLSGTPGFERASPSRMAAPEDFSAPPDPGSGPSQVPVDGGLTLLALAGVGYAGKKLRDRRRA